MGITHFREGLGSIDIYAPFYLFQIGCYNLPMKNMGSKLEAFSLYGECYHVSMKGQLIVVNSKFTTVSLV